MKTTKFVCSIGLLDKDTCTQIHSDEDAMRVVSNYLASHFFGSTAYFARGIYKMQNTGEIILEPTIRVELFDTEHAKVLDFCKWAKEILNQESIALETIEENVDFV